MPLFDYSCRQCNHDFEKLVRGNEPVACPQCNGLEVERLLGVPARPSAESTLPMSCNPEGPSCGAPWCRKN